MSSTTTSSTNQYDEIDNTLRTVLSGFSELQLAILFGSVAKGQARVDSDLDIAVLGKKPLCADEQIQIISALAEATGRPIDLIDLKIVGVPLLGQILKHGRRLFGTDTLYGQLISRNLFDQADFMPYRNRILAERRALWIGK
jgi:predicted nucleotidyltransferase